ncbi:acetyltransferase [Geobacter anodireducens]|nr:acetyltransferase [Geobacter anodireducens]
MKIQKPAVEARPKIYALLRSSFPGSDYEAALVQKLHENDRFIHEWACIIGGKVIAYIAFTNAYHGRDVCGLHLAPMAVAPEFQGRGVGLELLRFALRQEAINSQTLFVLGEPAYYGRFGFESCSTPICPFDKNNEHFLSMRNTATNSFVVGYEPEFTTVAPSTGTPKSKKRGKR